MEYMEQAIQGPRISLKIDDFDLAQTFECGQCFRWDYDGKDWHGYAMGRELYIHQDRDRFDFFPCTQREFAKMWVPYFDLDTDYAAAKEKLCADEHVKKGIDYAGGIHILHQEKFETLISFILSANNNIKRVKRILSRICEQTGTAIGIGQGYSFPTPGQLAALSIDDLHEIGAGYRARYVYDTTQAILNGFKLDAVPGMEYKAAREKLCELPGVGKKVADCVLLFSMGFRCAFPVDTWVKQVLEELYCDCGASDPQEYAYEKFGENAGLAQQYLFHYVRNRKTKDMAGEKAKGCES